MVRGLAHQVRAVRESTHILDPLSLLEVTPVSYSDFSQAYLSVAVFVVASGVIMAAMLGVGRLVRPTRPQDEKYLSYESGVDPADFWGAANVRYYLYGLLFVIFDVEAAFIFPWAIQLEEFGVFGLVEMLVFIAILVLGLVYAWRKGVLKLAS